MNNSELKELNLQDLKETNGGSPMSQKFFEFLGKVAKAIEERECDYSVMAIC
jgi:hypothetical protein